MLYPIISTYPSYLSIIPPFYFFIFYTDLYSYYFFFSKITQKWLKQIYFSNFFLIKILKNFLLLYILIIY